MRELPPTPKVEMTWEYACVSGGIIIFIVLEFNFVFTISSSECILESLSVSLMYYSRVKSYLTRPCVLYAFVNPVLFWVRLSVIAFYYFQRSEE